MVRLILYLWMIFYKFLMFSFCVVIFRHLSPLVRSDIIVLDYIANGQQIQKLEENEKVSLKFSKKLKNIKKPQVSQHIIFDNI